MILNTLENNGNAILNYDNANRFMISGKLVVKKINLNEFALEFFNSNLTFIRQIVLILFEQSKCYWLQNWTISKFKQCMKNLCGNEHE